MRFVKLTEKIYDNETREIYVNLEHIVSMMWEAREEWTAITTGRAVVYVTETPEQILVKTKAIGG